MPFIRVFKDDFELFAGSKFAIWEVPTSGDRYGPYKDPSTHIDLLKFHSDCQYLAVEEVVDVVVNHTSLAGLTGTPISGAPTSGGANSGSAQPVSNGDMREDDIVLLTHGRGTVPIYAVLYDGEIIAAGTNVQLDGDRGRLVSSWATTTQIGIKAIAISGATALSAATRTYRVILFRSLTATPGQPPFSGKPDEINFGGDKITADNRPLRRADVGEAIFYIPLEPTTDIRNGAIRSISPISGIRDLGLYNGSMFSLEAIEVTY